MKSAGVCGKKDLDLYVAFKPLIFLSKVSFNPLLSEASEFFVLANFSWMSFCLVSPMASSRA